MRERPQEPAPLALMPPKEVQPILELERIKQYPGRLQVDRRVMVNAPGRFFTQLLPADQAKDYPGEPQAQAAGAASSSAAGAASSSSQAEQASMLTKEAIREASGLGREMIEGEDAVAAAKDVEM